MSAEWTEIDGSMMEGGGQILRMTVALAALLKKPVRIHKIRAGRSSPGLKAQHLTGINLVNEMCGGILSGGSFGSVEISFKPEQLKGGSYQADTRSAGAVCLLAQISLPCALFAPKQTVLTLRGGTNADMAPQIDEYTEVFLPNLSRFGANFEFDVAKKGFFPKGGGEVRFFVDPVRCLSPVTLVDRGKVVSVEGWSFTAGSLPVSVAEQMTEGARLHLEQADCPELTGLPVKVETYKEAGNAAFGNGSGIVLVAKTSTGCVLGGSALGSPKVSPQETGRNAAEELLESVECGGCVDKHIQDQLVILMALAGGRSVLRTGPLTLHTETAIHIAQKLTSAKFVVRNDPDSCSWIIECSGIGLVNQCL